MCGGIGLLYEVSIIIVRKSEKETHKRVVHSILNYGQLFFIVHLRGRVKLQLPNCEITDFVNPPPAAAKSSCPNHQRLDFAVAFRQYPSTSAASPHWRHKSRAVVQAALSA